MNRSHRRIGVVLLLAIFAPAALGAPPYKTRQDILNYGVTAIGSPYVWGGGQWDPNDRSFGGADCSGFVSKCWSISRWTPYRVNLHGPSTYSYIQTPGSDWFEVDRAEMLYGDAIVYRYNENQSGHTYIYVSGDGWGEHEVYEARGTDYGIVHRWRTAYEQADQTKGIRYEHLIENVDVTEFIIETDDGALAYTDSGMTGNSQYDSHALGCREGDCRYRWVTASRSETCTFRPTLPETGWYRVYVTCNEDSPNVQNVGVTVNHAGGSNRFLWDQDDAAHLNQWVPIGDQAFLFNAGDTGTVVWDDFDATPTDGNHVFRGDATKFVLENRVEVDGIGGAPGRFASVSDALDWIGSHESEEPDIINITCDTLVESGCLEINLLDDVTINGDADGNGAPVTIVVDPSVPSDYSRPCGLYLDIPIQHQYTVRDVVLIPQFVMASYTTNAYGLVIDEQNADGEACAWSLTLENVTVAGSLAGNLPTDPLVDSVALATMFGYWGNPDGAAVMQRTSDWAGDSQCRQTVQASGLVITHSASRGLVLSNAYTDWHIDGGLRVTHNWYDGIRGNLNDGSTLTIRDSSGVGPNLIANNNGAGVMNFGGSGVQTMDVGNCLIRDNSNRGVVSEDAGTIVRDSIIRNNSAGGSGGGVVVDRGNMTVSHCTIVDNTAPDTGGVYATSANVTLSHSIVWNNGASPVGGTVTALYSNVEGGYVGTGMIDADPRFVDPATDDFHLLRSSPCINAGNSAFVPAAGETDVDGDPRVQGGYVDLGADETSFWAGDGDADGDVDLDDHAVLFDCLAGPEVSPAPTPPTTVADCLDAFDFDDDGDVDLRDTRFVRLRSGSITVADILLEVRDTAGTVLTPPTYVESGNWMNSTAKSTLAELTGSGSRWIEYDLPSTGTDNATIVPAIGVSGWYQVFVTWGTGANCYDAQYTIRHADGETTLLIDQIPEGVAGANANTWVSLGAYRFEAGQDAATGSINVSEETVTGKPHSGWNQRVYTDALKCVFISP